MANHLTILELPLPRKNYLLNASALADLATIQAHDPMTETEAVHRALRNLAEMLNRGIPVYMSSPPQAPEPPTSAPAAARRRPLQVVEKPHGARRTPRAKGPSNTKQRKK